MFRIKTIFLSILLLAIFLSSCAPGSEFTLPPGLTLIPGTDIPQQVATFVSGALTQTAYPATPMPVVDVTTIPSGNDAPATPTPLPANPSAYIPYQSVSLGIQFNYPSNWYLQETPGGVTLTSYHPANPPHKLEWTDQTVSMQFGFKVFIVPPASFDAWVESAKQAALSAGLSIYAEERFQIANQSAAHLTLVSGSGGVIHQVLTGLSGRYIEINIEGNYNLAKTVLDSIQPLSSSELKPADSETPASGICSDAAGDPVNIILGIDPASGMPLGGRCVAIRPTQRVKYINQSSETAHLFLGQYHIELPMGSESLVDRPVGEYLALGVHFMPMGPELWVKDSAAVTAPPPIVEYNNSTLGYKLNLPGDWQINETNSMSKEVIFSPPYAEPFIAYLSISLESRTLDQVINVYAQNMNVVREDTMFYGYPSVKYTFTSGRNEYFIPYGNQLFLIATDRPNDSLVQSILMTFRFTTHPQPVTYDATMADNGKTFVLNIGDEIRINLDYAYGWTITSDFNPAILIGAGAGYHAIASGTTTLTMNGDPVCYSSTPPCLMPSILYTITVTVR